MRVGPLTVSPSSTRSGTPPSYPRRKLNQRRAMSGRRVATRVSCRAREPSRRPSLGSGSVAIDRTPITGLALPVIVCASFTGAVCFASVGGDVDVDHRVDVFGWGGPGEGGDGVAWGDAAVEAGPEVGGLGERV